MLAGQFVECVDEHGKLLIPEPFRNEMNGNRVVCWQYKNEPDIFFCLPKDLWISTLIEEEIDAVGITELDVVDGCLCLTEKMLRTFGSDSITLIGAASRIELWPTTLFEERMRDFSMENIENAMKQLDFD